MAKTGVIGAGSWGTALALVLHQNGHEVTLWSHSEASVKSLLKERELPGKLPGVKIPEEIQITGDLEQAIRGMDMLVLAVPSACIRSTARNLSLIHILPPVRYGRSKGPSGRIRPWKRFIHHGGCMQL